MNIVLISDGATKYSAFSLDTLAGIAGHGSVAEFLGACALRGELLHETAKQLGEPMDWEEGPEASVVLRDRLESAGHSVVDDPVAKQKAAERDAEFLDVLRYSQGEVLAQAGGLGKLKRTLTRSAVALSVAVATAIGGVAIPDAAHAQNTMERVAKDALGATAGAALFGQFGKGRGRDVMRIVGAAAGVVVAESMQRPAQPSYPNGGYPNGTYSGGTYQNSSGYGQPAFGGTVPLSMDKAEKMSMQQRSYLSARDAYARALLNAQQAEENRVLEPRSEEAARAASVAGGAAQTAGQRYNQVRADFVTAYEVLGRNGYVMQDFAYAYSLAQRPVSARDIAPRELLSDAGMMPQMPQRQVRAVAGGYEY